jgi:hypothetical protein
VPRETSRSGRGRSTGRGESSGAQPGLSTPVEMKSAATRGLCCGRGAVADAERGLASGFAPTHDGEGVAGSFERV